MMIIYTYATRSGASLPDLRRLNTLWIAENSLTGPIEALGELIHLSELSIHVNQLSGTVGCLRNIPYLTDLSLHHNKFTGTLSLSLSVSLSQFLWDVTQT